MASKIYRLHYRGQLKEDYSADELEDAVQACVHNVRRAQADGKALTAALYRSGRMLFFYYEAIGEPLAVTEPIAIAEGTSPAESAAAMRDVAVSGRPVLPESGEDVQLTCLRPEELLEPLAAYLQVWPGQKSDRLWVHMYHIYYHSVPESTEQWKRAAVPEKRRGRIAFLRDDKLFSYTYFHKAIVDEGLLTGDKYQSIALHENILFSYFEEPKTFVNVQGDPDRESQVIKDWLAVDPESHFIHMPLGKGENFMFLPALFAVGVEM
ncbi:MAG: hypothetical protein HFH06_04070 [Lachnospiraceae bacterium]|jgi:hypothetical protein|nr:hypothetical protein [Lachnospiraceae bacterium]